MKKIDLGCADNKPSGYIGVDKVKMNGVDIVHDCIKGLPFKDNEADIIRSADFIEHIPTENIINLMNEIWRVLKDGGRFDFKIPDAERGQGAFQDPTHRSFWVKNSFKYYNNDYYRKLYNIKAKFSIGELESIEYEVEKWGRNYTLVGHLIAIKSDKKIDKKINETKMFNSSIIFTTDDVSIDNLKYFKYWDRIKEKHPELKLIAFVIAKGLNDDFKKWYEKRKDWVEIGVHCYDHERPQEGWKYDQEVWIKKARDILKPYLPKRYLYRPPGFRTLPKTEGILKKLGFAGIAHQELIKYFDTGDLLQPLFNSHCCDGNEDKIINPITKVWQNLMK